LLVIPAGRAQADNLDVALLEHGPAILEQVRQQGAKTIGVLPFRLGKANQPPRYNVASLNANLAVRLENALLLFDDPKQPLKIVHDAGKTAARGRSASYLAAAGRKALFALSYPVAWGSGDARVDLFLTGDAQLAADNRTLSVAIKAFDQKGSDLRPITQFVVPTDRSMLADCGQSFTLRPGSLAAGADPEDLAAANAAHSPAAEPLSGGEESIRLTILYAGNPVRIEHDPANPGERRARMVLPKSRALEAVPMSSEVVLVVENTSPTTTVAVALKVNGKNVRLLALDQAVQGDKWVLPPAKDGHPSRWEVKGFWLDEKGHNLLPFRIPSEEETRRKQSEFDDVEKLGLIELHVFQAGTQATTSGRTVDLRGFSALERSKQHAAGLAELQTALRKKTHAEPERILADARSATGKPTKSLHSRTVRPNNEASPSRVPSSQPAVLANPEEVLFRAIRYYTPGGRSPR
jgi:hypothetical protein